MTSFHQVRFAMLSTSSGERLSCAFAAAISFCRFRSASRRDLVCSGDEASRNERRILPASSRPSAALALSLKALRGSMSGPPFLIHAWILRYAPTVGYTSTPSMPAMGRKKRLPTPVPKPATLPATPWGQTESSS